MSAKNRLINKISTWIIVLWSLVIAIVMAMHIYQNYNYAKSLAINEARVSVQKDLAFRSWGASHGGVYVPITKRTPPNPYLSHIKNRDVTTNDGQHLTLMNPAYTLSQMMKDYTKLYGIKGHITSLTLLNPKNRPDSWERRGLKKAEKSGKPVIEEVHINGKGYIRYLNPMVTKKSCLKCHAFQGYKAGDIRGGVSVSIPLERYYSSAFYHSLLDIFTLLVLYLIGLFAILYGKKKTIKTVEEKIKDYEQNIYALVNLIEKRDSYTAGHTRRVAKYSTLIAKEMGFDKDALDDLYQASMLHDIGKISTPDAVLLKPGGLNDLEYDIIKEHVVVGYELLKDIDIYRDIAQIIRYHHERYDGKGYPYGLKGDRIPMLSQVMTVADAFDAMTTDRVYKSKKSVSQALKEIERFSGAQFNPKVAKAALKALRDIEVDSNISQIPTTKREQERFAYFFKDIITDTYNQDYLTFMLMQIETNRYDYSYIYGLFLHNFTQYNQKNGWAEGDKLLAKVAKEIKNIYAEDIVLFRMYGDDFILLSREKFDMQVAIDALTSFLDNVDISVTAQCYNIKEKSIKTLIDVKDIFSC